MYRTLVAEANAGLPQLHRCFELHRKLLGLSDRAYYDIYPPLVPPAGAVSTPQTRSTVLAVVKPPARTLPRPGKTSGAYMNPDAYDVHPYLLLNLGENYQGMTTYAHE